MATINTLENADHSMDVRTWARENSDSFNFEYISTQMLPDEFAEYKRSLVEDTIAFFESVLT